MNHAKLLLIVSSLFGLWGVLMGAHMAGGGSYALSAIHAHVLVLGWLTLFAWSLFHKIYQPNQKRLAAFQAWTGIAGAILLTSGMWLYNTNPFDLPRGVTLGFYIGGGMTVVISFLLFVVLACLTDSKKRCVEEGAMVPSSF